MSLFVVEESVKSELEGCVVNPSTTGDQDFYGWQKPYAYTTLPNLTYPAPPVDSSREIELLKQIAELAKEKAELWKEIAELRGKK